MSQVDPQIVRHIARLARLELNDREIERFSHQLSEILTYADQLKAVDVTGVAPTAHPLPVRNVFREDEPTEPLGAERILANAPQAEGDCFALPKVLEQEDA